MFIWTAKIDRRKIGLGALAVLLVGAVVCGCLVFAGRDAVASAAVGPKGIKTADDRRAYLETYGWQVSADAVSVEELQFPKEFGPEYDEYLQLQSGQGFDLTKYGGKRVKRYTYDVKNYPTGATDAQAHLLLYRDTVVGGEVLGEGFFQGLTMP